MILKLDKPEWRRVRFGDVAERSREQVDQTNGKIERYVAGGHFPAGAVEVVDYGHPADGGMGSTFTYAFSPGDVLYVSASWYLRKVGVATFDGVVADKTYVLKSRDEEVLDQRFLPWILLSDELHDYAAAQATGSMNARLLWSALANFDFDLPPLGDQRRIADLLWAIESHEQGLRKMESENRSSRSVWFGEMLRQGVAEREWTRRPVPSLILSGPTNGKSARANDEQRGVPTLSLSAIRDGRVLGGSSVKYMDVPPSDVANLVIEYDDFLVVRGNGNKQLTGRGGLAAGGLPEGCIYPDLLMRLRFDPSTIHPAFAVEQWNSSLAHSELIQRAKSTNGIWKINGQDIKSHQLVLPPLSTQLEMLERLETFDRASAVVNAEAAVLHSVRSTVLREIFGGN